MKSVSECWKGFTVKISVDIKLIKLITHDPEGGKWWRRELENITEFNVAKGKGLGGLLLIHHS